MSVSILIVNYNAGEMLQRCVTAALACPQAVEVLVADNGSEDGSFNLAPAPRLRLLPLATNLGFAAAVNRLLAEAKGEFLLILNPDCLLTPQALEALQQALQDHPTAGMAGAQVRDGEGRLEAACRRRVPTPLRALVRALALHKLWPHAGIEYPGALPEHVTEIEGISGACMLVRRAAVQQVGGMDEAYFLHCEDLDWFMRFRAGGWSILFVPQAQVTHYQGTCSRRTPLKVLWFKHRGMVRFYRKFFQAHYPRLVLWGVIGIVWLRFGVLALGQMWRNRSRLQPPPPSPSGRGKE